MNQKEALGKLKCFTRVHIMNEDGTLAGDSGWTGPNMVTNLGIQNYLAGAVFAVAGSSQVGYMAVGGTDSAANSSNCTIASNATTLPGEVSGSTQRVTISKTYSSRPNVASQATQYCYATFASGFVTGAGVYLVNVGMYAATGGGGTMFCGNTYSGSACASNQAVNVTYQVQMG